jgi:hypothetical protein
MQLRVSEYTESCDVTGVLRNFRLDQDDMHDRIPGLLPDEGVRVIV